MSLSTKSVGSLLIASWNASSKTNEKIHPKKRLDSRFQRILQRHDRKKEIQSNLLQMNPQDIKSGSKVMGFNKLIKLRGFADMDAFKLALIGKLRADLLQRGWTRRKIDSYVAFRSSRIN